MRALLGLGKGRHEPNFSGPYTTWQEAIQNSGGYDEKSILDRTLQASLKVKQGLAAYERDGVIFNTIQVSPNQQKAFGHVLQATQGHLHVIDFGGSLGTSYFLNRKVLKDVTDFKWAIVEQSHYVIAGNLYIAEPPLAFFNNLQEAARIMQPDMLLVSGSVQYIENARLLLEQMRDMNLPYLLFDRTFFIDKHHDCIAVQNVPESIYTGSYPCHLFNEAAFLSIFAGKYNIVMQFDSDYDSPDHLHDNTIQVKGMLLARR